MSKTPEEIKKGLECCQPEHKDGIWITCKSICPFLHDFRVCRNALHADALAYIQQLESRLAQVERERDAAVRDISYFFPSPEVCKHYEYCQSVQEDPFHGCFGSVDCADYQYRGVCEENTKEDSNV